MAQYEQSTTSVTTTLGNSGLSSDTLAAITHLLSGSTTTTLAAGGGSATVPAGTKIVTVGSGQTLTSDPGSPIIIMDHNAPGANVVLQGNTDRVVVTGGGDNHIVFTGSGNSTVQTGGGNDTIDAGSNTGNTNVNVAGGNSSVQTGSGSDTVTITGSGNVTVITGSGNDTIVFSSDAANSTIDGGTGFDVLVVHDSHINHTVTIENGHLVVHSAAPAQITNIQVIEYSDGISVVASTHDQAIVARMYEVAFGREADVAGINFWMDQLTAGQPLSQIITDMSKSNEFKTNHASQTNDAFLTSLYLGLANRTPDAAGLAYWEAQFASGATQADVALHFAQSQEAITLMGITGTQYVIDNGIG